MNRLPGLFLALAVVSWGPPALADLAIPGVPPCNASSRQRRGEECLECNSTNARPGRCGKLDAWGFEERCSKRFGDGAREVWCRSKAKAKPLPAAVTEAVDDRGRDVPGPDDLAKPGRPDKPPRPLPLPPVNEPAKPAPVPPPPPAPPAPVPAAGG